jgi:hypothetical protein
VQGNKLNDNEAVLQLQVTKQQQPFLSTLAKDGQAQFLTVLKPCGILLPHVHQRSNEFYSVLFGAHSPDRVTIPFTSKRFKMTHLGHQHEVTHCVTGRNTICAQSKHQHMMLVVFLGPVVNHVPHIAI